MNDLSNSAGVTVKQPKKVYCVRIENIPSNVDGQTLARKFNWPLGYILINSSPDDQSSSIECWLKEMNDRRAAEDFVQKWDKTSFLGSSISCTIEEDQPDLCKNFRAGMCIMASDGCDWDHVKCTANGMCARDCPYGHDKGVKTGTYKYSKFYS